MCSRQLAQVNLGLLIGLFAFSSEVKKDYPLAEQNKLTSEAEQQLYISTTLVKMAEPQEENAFFNQPISSSDKFGKVRC